ncbi:hypothetical protein [Caballeronia grimmiae]|uniref:Uncharacterized protein n=1 Tax=Caballeronia grimmiae TaxID=1071679 RepID=A0A069NDQ3_9BURK|nr:hypothetical protein [Caballeronia grimmiae]KDR26490.1 hypothetical protein BG57_26435 [Caballeronia grimmiae]GGD96577.1 hypothetical protein GCM10010985_59040 [Caballeronia grimmiae]
MEAADVARYALVIHDGMTPLGDDEPPSRWPMRFDCEIQCIDAALEMAGIDTTQALHPPNIYWKDDDADDGGGLLPGADD